jgi:hypothetical protein
VDALEPLGEPRHILVGFDDRTVLFVSLGVPVEVVLALLDDGLTLSIGQKVVLGMEGAEIAKFYHLVYVTHVRPRLPSLPAPAAVP